jgi:hypothetical protein
MKKSSLVSVRQIIRQIPAKASVIRQQKKICFTFLLPVAHLASISQYQSGVR